MDAVAVSRGLMRFVKGSLLNECCDIVITDHRLHVVDVNLEDYFDQ